MAPATKIHSVAGPAGRPSGLAPVPEVQWGEHVSAFYGTADDLLEIVGGYFAAGIAGNEMCLWITSDPFTVEQARKGLREYIPDIDERLTNGSIVILEGEKWYLTNDSLDVKRVFRFLHDELDAVLQRGFEGVRAVGNAFWLRTKYWETFSRYEFGLSGEFRGERIIILCTYPLNEARAVDVLDVTKAHDFSIARRDGSWQFLESPDLVVARREIDRLNVALDILSLPFPGREKLTPRERITLAQIVRGASNKEAARALRISPRTVEFHRANIMRKLGARNIADLLGLVLSSDNQAT
jgi:DNA-binding CsgD family transcriptional regulator